MIVKRVQQHREAVVVFEGIVPTKLGGADLGRLVIQGLDADVELGVVKDDADPRPLTRRLAFRGLLLAKLGDDRRLEPGLVVEQAVDDGRLVDRVCTRRAIRGLSRGGRRGPRQTEHEGEPHALQPSPTGADTVSFPGREPLRHRIDPIRRALISHYSRLSTAPLSSSARASPPARHFPQCRGYPRHQSQRLRLRRRLGRGWDGE